MTRIPPAPISVWRPTTIGRFLRGAPHYPEHVDASFMVRDAERLRAVGANCVRMGEFAWHMWEPREGHFEFALFDTAIDILGQHGIDTILCTPTATPPRWLTRAYPQVLRVDAQGRTAQHGSRQHADTTSPVYREHSRRITAALAQHYRGNRHVIGWQTDNELNNTVSESYSPSCLTAFQDWLRQSYGNDIAALNLAWGGNFWALAYDDFGDIDLPRPYAPTYPAPAHLLDYHRFLAAATAAFQTDQIDILRAENPDWFVFHDVGGTNDIDFRGPFGREVDFLGFNNYPMLYDEFSRDGGHALSQAWRMDVSRASTGNFIVPEQVCGMGAQPGFTSMTPEPGEMRRMAYSAIAHGADGLMFFRWRPAHFGAEIYWMGLIDHDDTPRRRYDEASQFFHEVAGMEATLLGTHVRMDVGIAGADFDAQEAHNSHPMGLPSPMDDAMQLYAACYGQNIPCGLIHPEDDLTRLKVLYVPHWVIWKPEWTAAVSRFVEQGGTLILSAMTGTRDSFNQIHSVLAPAAGLGALTGVEVEEFGRLIAPGASGLIEPMGSRIPGAYTKVVPPPASSASRRYEIRIGNRTMTAGHLYERLRLGSDTQTVGTWSNEWLEGEPALTRKSVGKGQVYYLATYLTAELADVVITQVILPADVRPLLDNVPAGVEVAVREAEDRQIWFILNTTSITCQLPNSPSGQDLVTGTDWPGGPLVLSPYGCAIICFRQ